ncbi:MAG: Sec-independent protein translocase protein TatB [Gammaproteobacteria bacterium]|nr:Sec-independent protein translocase protein TatB [Gammaproteobacteria bacterium]
MFDIGFPELLIVSIVALLVIGPEKLPETVRTVAIWVGRLKRSLVNIKTELENEIGADEIRRELRNDAIMRELSEAKQNVESIMNDANTTIGEIKESSRIDTGAIMKPIDKGNGAPGPRETETRNDGTKQSEPGG